MYLENFSNQLNIGKIAEKEDFKMLLKKEVARNLSELKRIKAMIPFSKHRGVENESILKMMKSANDTMKALK